LDRVNISDTPYPLKFDIASSAVKIPHFENKDLVASESAFHPSSNAKTFKTCEWCRTSAEVNAICIFGAYV